MRHRCPGRTTLLTLLALTAPLPASAQIQPAPTPDAGLLDTLMTQLAAVPERRADFTEERHFAALTTNLHSQGWLLYQRPAYLRKMTTAPQPENLTVQGDELRDTPANQAERIVSLASQPAIAALVDAVRGPLSGNLPGLRKHYQVTASGTLAAWHLALLPTDPSVQQLLHDIAIDGTNTDLRTIRITQTNGDTQTMTITPTP